MDFIEKWARFVCGHSDREWSQLQKELIDSQIENAQMVKLTRKQADAIKRKKGEGLKASVFVQSR